MLIAYNAIMKMLLLSNSGDPLYQWCKTIIADFLKNKTVDFISAAYVYDYTEYFNQAKRVLKPLGLKLNHLSLDSVSKNSLDNTEAFIVGGGNTYRLLHELQKHNLLKPIRKRVLDGALYVGLSAGANIAGPNILTTNDWNVVGSTSFEGLNLVPFSINPHYNAPQDKILSSAESRDQRIYEYFEFYDNPVIALEEQTYLEINDDEVIVGGQGIAKVFLKNKEPIIYKSGELIKLHFF